MRRLSVKLLVVLPVLSVCHMSDQYYYDTVTPAPSVTPQPPPLSSHR